MRIGWRKGTIDLSIPSITASERSIRAQGNLIGVGSDIDRESQEFLGVVMLEQGVSCRKAVSVSLSGLDGQSMLGTAAMRRMMGCFWKK